MGSTGEPDRKRRHFSSLSPTAAAKKQPFSPISEDKKLDIAVLQYQNQKLIQKLETQKVEYSALESKFSQLTEKQQPYDSTLTVVKKSWEELVSDLEACSIHTRDSSSKLDSKHMSIMEDGNPSTVEDVFLSRLVETGATSSSTSNFTNQMEVHRETASEKVKNILRNVVTAINKLWCLKDGLLAAILKELPEDASCRKKTSSDVEVEVKNLRLAFGELHLKHKSLARELQNQLDIDTKHKAEVRRLKGDLENIVAELEESNSKLAALKIERDASKGAVFPVLNLGSNHVQSDRVRDKQKDLQDMESSLKELKDQASCRLLELKSCHEERIKILEQLCDFQNIVKNVKCISDSQSFLLVRDQIEKSKSEVLEYQALFEKLQVEKDNLAWKEREWNIKSELVGFFQRSSAVADFRVSDLEIEIQKQIEDRNMIESKLDEAAREPGRKQLISEFRSLVSSFPEEMGTMQTQLSKFKEAATNIHSLRADVQSLSSILDRKELKLGQLFFSYFSCDGRESIDSRDVLEAWDSEYKAWAHVQSLKSSLDEHNLEIRVKTANEAEAVSQQRLAAAEAEIVELRQNLEASKRDMSRHSDVLKSKNEENEAYLSEIETIGQAYDDMQTQNQHLLQQITERDDYNIKVVLEGVRARQKQDALVMDKRTIEQEIQQANVSLNFYDMKAGRIQDQRSSQQTRDLLDEVQSKVGNSRVARMELQTELERERFAQKRIEEELEVARRNASCLRAQIEGSTVVQKLQQELGEYREIVKCSICCDREKEVVITKCYHLFCNPCVQKIVEGRHRKCPRCAASFGRNDVKPIYL
ncbi:E3 ubiquitin protein ligase [Quillaja saponaria]|uniref:E3 ubiquitin protein ligase n=1 Tax=Quillaja saponaria TaxID=32244 RepID=A0AAD7PPF7_QUISA|nr:E3 ubiquitin protein ligase [Quillaja saponaria]